MVIVKSCSQDISPDIASTVKVYVPSVVGVPEIVPSSLSVNPKGSNDASADHTTEPSGIVTASRTS